MGTRADFYLGRGEGAEWLGSIAWDGYPEGLDNVLKGEMTHEQFMAAVDELAKRDDWTSPKDGWPWPWNDSCTTDFAYALEDGKVFVSCFGATWATWAEAAGDDHDWDDEKMAFPNMKDRQSVTYGKRSGTIILGIK